MIQEGEVSGDDDCMFMGEILVTEISNSGIDSLLSTVGTVHV